MERVTKAALRSRVGRPRSRGLVSFELVLYASVGVLLGIAGVLIIIGTVSGPRDRRRDGAVDVAVLVLDRVLLALIVGELLYTLRFVVRTHEIAVEPFLYIGLIAVVRRILIVTAQFERSPQTGRALTNTLLEFGLLGLMVPGDGSRDLARAPQPPRRAGDDLADRPAVVPA